MRPRNLIAARVAPYVREGRRQWSAGLARLRAPRLPAGPDRYCWVRHRRVSVRARIQATLNLAAQQQALADRLGRELAERGVPYGWLPGSEGGPATLCVPAEHRPAVLAAVGGLGRPSGYVDALGPCGRPRDLLLLAARAEREPALRRSAGLVVWEFVVARPGSGFLAGRAQGVRIGFWDLAGSGRRVSRLPSQTATELPADAAELGGPTPAVGPRLAGSCDFPVDVVYTWVDGTDPAWLHTKAQAAGVADEALFTERANDEARFADHDELRYSLRALEQFAPWVNHVWIVTAGQRPPWLVHDHPWVSVVDHTDLWPGPEGLPTFNSHAIEACLHRIPGLAEHFLYLNDDMLFGRPVRAEQFFHASGIGKLFLSRALVDFGPSYPGEIASSSAAKNARRLLQERYGVTPTRKFFHTAAALTVSGLERLEAEFPAVVARTRGAAFRTLDDVAVAGSFYLNWAWVTGRSVPGRLRYTYIDPAAPDATRRLTKLARNRAFDAFCINDGSSEESVEQRARTDRLIRDFLADYLPVPGSFERSPAQASNWLGSGK